MANFADSQEIGLPNGWADGAKVGDQSPFSSVLKEDWPADFRVRGCRQNGLQSGPLSVSTRGVLTTSNSSLQCVAYLRLSGPLAEFPCPLFHLLEQTLLFLVFLGE